MPRLSLKAANAMSAALAADPNTGTTNPNGTVALLGPTGTVLATFQLANPAFGTQSGNPPITPLAGAPRTATALAFGAPQVATAYEVRDRNGALCWDGIPGSILTVAATPADNATVLSVSASVARHVLPGSVLDFGGGRFAIATALTLIATTATNLPVAVMPAGTKPVAGNTFTFAAPVGITGSGAECQLDNTSIAPGQTVNLTALNLTGIMAA